MLKTLIQRCAVVAHLLACWGEARTVASPTETAIFWVSGPVDPGGTVMVTGQYRVSGTLSVKLTNLSGCTNDWRKSVDQNATNVPVLKVTEHVVMFAIPATGDAKYGFRIDQPGLQPLYGRVNLPEIWWTLVTPPETAMGISGPISKNTGISGSTLQIFGRCMQQDGRPDNVEMQSKSGTTTTLKPISTNPYSLAVKIPTGLPPGSYTIAVTGGANQVSTKSNSVQFEVKDHNKDVPLTKVDIQAFGAVGDGSFDNSQVLEKALAEAAKLKPAVISIPKGLFMVSRPIEIPSGVYLAGESREGTAIYFRDSQSPPDSWISGTNSFGLSDISIFCSNHKTIISSDRTGDAEKSGHIRLRNVLIRGNAFSGHISADVMAQRSALLLQGLGAHFEAILLSGPDIEISGCDILGSGQSLNLFKADGAIVQHNTFYNGRFGSYGLGGCEEVTFTDNEIVGADLSSYGGSYSVSRYAKVSRNIYTAYNRYSRFRGWDNESFTSDGGGGAYFGGVLQTVNNSIVLAGEPRWEDLDWQGTLVAITAGRGMGQWRTLESRNGRKVQLSSAFEIQPDETSTLTIVPLQLRYVFYKNRVTDAGIAIQFFGAGVEQVAQENTSQQAGGLRIFTLNYFNGVQPQLNIQIIGNQISGFGYQNLQPGLAPGISRSALDAQSHPPSAIIGLVLRGNSLGENCSIVLQSWSRAGMKSVLLDRNSTAGGKKDIHIDDVIKQEVVVR